MFERGKDGIRNVVEGIGSHLPVSHEIEVPGLHRKTPIKDLFSDKHPDVSKVLRRLLQEGKDVSVRVDSGNVKLIIAVTAGVVGSFAGYRKLRKRK